MFIFMTVAATFSYSSKEIHRQQMQGHIDSELLPFLFLSWTSGDVFKQISLSRRPDNNNE